LVYFLIYFSDLFFDLFVFWNIIKFVWIVFRVFLRVGACIVSVSCVYRACIVRVSCVRVSCVYRACVYRACVAHELNIMHLKKRFA